MKYIKGLDSLRAIAVLLVICWHWLPRSGFNHFPTGPAGVIIFFVLSGFLITRILIEGRLNAAQVPGGKKTFLSNFIFRRALRILPIYYLVLIPAFLYTVYMKQDASRYAYFLTFTSNFYFFKIKAWDNYFAHTWTLAVEEQFYLVWPLIILFIKRSWMLPCILLFIAIGVASQVMIHQEGFQMYLLYSCFDSFAIGALLAWVAIFRYAYLERLARLARTVIPAMLLLLYLELSWWHTMLLPFRLQVAVITLLLISYIISVAGNTSRPLNLFSRVMNNSVLAQIGKISYSMYLYHIFIPKLTGFVFYATIYNLLPAFARDHFPFFSFPINFAVLLLVSAASWRYIEKPILRLKDYSFGIANNKWVVQYVKKS